MQTTTSVAYKNQPFMATLYANTARAAKAGCCPCCAIPRELKTQDGVTYKLCPKCGDAQEVAAEPKATMTTTTTATAPMPLMQSKSLPTVNVAGLPDRAQELYHKFEFENWIARENQKAHLQADAEAMNAARMETAAHEHAFYAVIGESGNFGDGSPAQVRIQQAGRSDNPRYTIERTTGTCTCPDFTGRIAPMREGLRRVGLGWMADLLCCKHGFIVEEKRTARLLERGGMA